MAQVWELPEEIATAVLPVPRLDVWVGVFRLVVVPSPSMPPSFHPQQLTDALSRIAQVWYCPEEIATAVLPVPRLEVWVGVLLSLVVPSPSPPTPLYPQQLTDALSRIAQVWYCPEEIATAVLPVPRLEVWVGVLLSLVVPSPNAPLTLYPQQLTDASSRIAQVCSPPEEIATAVLPVPRLDVW
jgi:hypothetical protein